ncbi:nuclear transport factor 2 family protein [Streptomyces sp. NPDC001851]|uniref:nuclear transport factor 2 family protein n=1 Tax=Streptomyces sp. NPDC001851 TaxID=3154529 RepID=UPI00332FAC9A
MHGNQPRTITPDDLPEVITRYLTAHRVHDTAAAVTTFTDDATVIDDGNTYQGSAAIERWLDRSATEFTYTIRLRRPRPRLPRHPHLPGRAHGARPAAHRRLRPAAGPHPDRPVRARAQ